MEVVHIYNDKHSDLMIYFHVTTRPYRSLAAARRIVCIQLGNDFHRETFNSVNTV